MIKRGLRKTVEYNTRLLIRVFVVIDTTYDIKWYFSYFPKQNSNKCKSMTGKKLLSAMLAGMKALSMLCRLIHHRVQRLCGSRVQRVVSRTMYITTLIMISCSLRSLTKYLVDSPPQYITTLQVVNPFRIRQFSGIIVKQKYTEYCKCAVL